MGTECSLVKVIEEGREERTGGWVSMIMKLATDGEEDVKTTWGGREGNGVGDAPVLSHGIQS